MKRIQKRIMLLAAVIALAACSTEKHEDPLFDDEVNMVLQDMSLLPEWLADYVGYLECSPEGKKLISSSGKTDSGIYRFKWNGNTYYEIFFPNQNKLHSNLFTYEGVPVELTEQYLKDFSENVYDWTIIYLFHPNQERFWEYPKNVYHTLSDIEFEKDSALTDFLNRTCDHHVNKFKIEGSNICYIVRNEKQLKTFYDGNIPLPEIDFSRYSLFVGTVSISDRAELKRIDFTRSTVTSKDLDDNVIHLHFENKLPIFQQDEFQNQKKYYFWALFPALEEDVTAFVDVKYNNQSLTGNTIKCYEWFRPLLSVDVTSIESDEFGGEFQIPVVTNIAVSSYIRKGEKTDREWATIMTRTWVDDENYFENIHVEPFKEKKKERTCYVVIENTYWQERQVVTLTQYKPLFIEGSSVIEIETKESLALDLYNRDSLEVKWESSDEKVATVNEEGVIVGVGDGECTITVTSADGKRSDNVKVVVHAPIAPLS